MQYTNIKLPLKTAWMNSGSDVQEVLKAIVGHGGTVIGPDWCDGVACPTIGYSAYGPWVEGDIDYADDDGHEYVLSYDFMEFGEDVGRIFRYEIIQQI